MKKPKLTIFTPTYNRQDLIKEVYKSLLEQTNKEFVWMIIDDGSNDNTKELVKKWISENKIKIEYYYKKNGGKHSAFNYMLDKLNTEYVLISLDSDDTLKSDAVKNIYKLFKNKEDGYVTPRTVSNSKQNKISSKYKKMIEKKHSLSFALKNNMLDMETILIFKSSKLKKFKFPIIENENFFTEAYIYYQMDFKMYWSDINLLSYSKYQEDGLTKNIINIFLKNPKSWYMFNKLRAKSNNSFLKKIKFFIYQLTFGILSKSKVIKETDNKICAILLYPIGIIGALYLKIKRNHKE